MLQHYVQVSNPNNVSKLSIRNHVLICMQCNVVACRDTMIGSCDPNDSIHAIFYIWRLVSIFCFILCNISLSAASLQLNMQISLHTKQGSNCVMKLYLHSQIYLLCSNQHVYVFISSRLNFCRFSSTSIFFQRYLLFPILALFNMVHQHTVFHPDRLDLGNPLCIVLISSL